MTQHRFRQVALSAICALPLLLVVAGCQKEVVTQAPDGGTPAANGMTSTPGTPSDGSSPTQGGITPSGSPTASTPSTAPGAKPGPAGSVSAGGGAIAEAPGSYRLAFKFEPGTTVKFRSTIDTKSEMPGGKGGPRSQSMESTSEYKVVKASGESATVETRIVDVKVPGSEGGPSARMLEDMKKEVTTVTYNARGEAISSETSNGDGDGRRGGRGMMGAMRTMSNMAGDIGFLGLVMPAGPVKVGDSWNSQYDLAKVISESMGGMGMPQMKVENGNVPVTYRFRSVDPAKGTAVIEFTSKGSPVMKMSNPMAGSKGGAKEGMPQMPDEISLTLKMDSSGTITIDLKTGMPIEIRSTNVVTTAMAGMGGMGDSKQSITTVTRRV